MNHVIMKSKIFKFFIYTLCFFSFFLVIPKCEKALPVVDSSDTILTSKLSDYYNFLVTMKSKGFVFWDFKTFLGTDTSKLPQKLIVIRHDIHGLDIQWAYPTFKIEQTLIGNGHSTFFVMSSERSTVAIQLVLAKDAAQMYVGGQ